MADRQVFWLVDRPINHPAASAAGRNATPSRL